MPTPVAAGPVGETQSRMILGLGMIGWSESEMCGANEQSSNALMGPMEEPGQGTSPSVHVRGIKCGCSVPTLRGPEICMISSVERTVRRTCD